MTVHEFVKFYIPAAYSILGDDIIEDESKFSQFEKLLGLTIFTDFIGPSNSYDKEPLPEDVVRLLKALGGPHGKTILKAYRIKKGLVDEAKENGDRDQNGDHPEEGQG